MNASGIVLKANRGIPNPASPARGFSRSVGESVVWGRQGNRLQARPEPWGGPPKSLPRGGRGGLQSKLAVSLVQLHPSWRKVGERVPRPRGWRHRSPGPLSVPARRVCAPGASPATAARSARRLRRRDCQLPVRKSTRHILASRGMKGGGAPGRSSELGVHPWRTRGQVSGWLGLGREEIRA